MAKDISNDLIIDAGPSEISIALLENKQLVELNKEKTNFQFNVGDIYLAKVKKIMPGLNAAFIDIGYEKDAFLHYLDLGPQFSSLKKYLSLALSRKGKPISIQKFRREKDIDKGGKIADVLQTGQTIIVQIVKEPISTKGPRLSSEISIAGRNLVLIPFSDKVSVSSKIESAEERNRLKRLILSIKPRNYGVIVRTVAESRKVAVLDAELKALVKKWESAFYNINTSKPPQLLVSELDRVSAILRDHLNVSFNSIVVNEASIHQELRDYIRTIAPEKEKIVKLYKSREPIFEKFGIQKQIKSSFGRTVSFKNGAYLIIEHTEALHVIDVNSGNRAKSVSNQETNAIEVNMAAAEEIARQLRLRDMGGIIVVDFIDMHTNEHKHKVYERLKQEMSKDKTKHNILPLSKFGLMQITRQRVRPEMSIQVNETCPTCKGTGEIGPPVNLPQEMEQKLTEVIAELGLKWVKLRVHPFVEAYVTRGFRTIRKKWQKKLGCKIMVEGMDAYTLTEFHLFDKEDEEIPL